MEFDGIFRLQNDILSLFWILRRSGQISSGDPETPVCLIWQLATTSSCTGMTKKEAAGEDAVIETHEIQRQ